MAAIPPEPGTPLLTTVQITTGDGSFDAAVATPANPNGHAVVVLQEIFGVTRKIRGYCEMFAREGYTAIAPDLFWRLERNLQLSYDEADIKRAMDLLARFDEARGQDDVKAAIDHLRKQGFRKVAVVGFCLGGKLATMATARGDADAAVGFYGVGLEHEQDALRTMGKPLQLHFGGKDEHIPQEVVTTVSAALSDVPNAEVHSYADGGHAFFRPDLKGTASPVAWDRTRAFLERHLS